MSTLALHALLAWLAAAPDAGTSCVTWEAQARPWGQSFNHFVTLKSACEVAMRCRVSTDVNPEAESVSLAPGQTKELNTFLASPVRAFTPKVECSAAK